MLLRVGSRSSARSRLFPREKRKEGRRLARPKLNFTRIFRWRYLSSAKSESGLVRGDILAPRGETRECAEVRAAHFVRRSFWQSPAVPAFFLSFVSLSGDRLIASRNLISQHLGDSVFTVARASPPPLRPLYTCFDSRNNMINDNVFAGQLTRLREILMPEWFYDK